MTIIVTDKARQELLKIKLYISNVAGARQAARNLISEIENKIDDLEIFPKRYKLWKNTKYRFFSVKNYLVFYCCDEPTETITVERVIYAHRDIEALL